MLLSQDVEGFLQLMMKSINFFAISGMPIASSQYWNSIHGREMGEASQDEEGLQTTRVLARNMSFLMKCIHDGKEKYGLPEKEEFHRTNFIR